MEDKKIFSGKEKGYYDKLLNEIKGTSSDNNERAEFKQAQVQASEKNPKLIAIVIVCIVGLLLTIVTWSLWIAGIFLIIAFAVAISGTKKVSLDQKKKLINFSFEYNRLNEIIKESIGVINRTKRVDTAISRFGVIKNDIERLLVIAPPEAGLSITIGDYYIKSADDIQLVDRVKEDWLKVFFRERIEVELKKADVLSNPTLKLKPLKKALEYSLESLEHLPDDRELAGSIALIESQISRVKSR